MIPLKIGLVVFIRKFKVDPIEGFHSWWDKIGFHWFGEVIWESLWIESWPGENILRIAVKVCVLIFRCAEEPSARLGAWRNGNSLYIEIRMAILRPRLRIGDVVTPGAEGEIKVARLRLPRTDWDMNKDGKLESDDTQDFQRIFCRTLTLGWGKTGSQLSGSSRGHISFLGAKSGRHRGFGASKRRRLVYRWYGHLQSP